MDHSNLIFATGISRFAGDSTPRVERLGKNQECFRGGGRLNFLVPHVEYLGYSVNDSQNVLVGCLWQWKISRGPEIHA